MTYDRAVHVYNNNIIAIKMYDERRKFAARREPHSPYTHIIYYKRVYIIIVYHDRAWLCDIKRHLILPRTTDTITFVIKYIYKSKRKMSPSCHVRVYPPLSRARLRYIIILYICVPTRFLILCTRFITV